MEALLRHFEKRTDHLIAVDYPGRSATYQGQIQFSNIQLLDDTVHVEVFIWKVWQKYMANTTGPFHLGGIDLMRHLLNLHYFPMMKIKITLHPHADILMGMWD
jgi:hypothetical protein